MNFAFTATKNGGGIRVPYIEDARADFAPYYDIRNRTLAQAQTEVVNEIAKLGGGAVAFQEGYFGSDDAKRYGYVLTFNYHGSPGIIRVAGLPMKAKVTDAKIEKVRLQALLNVRDWLKAAVTAQVFSPGSEPLMQYLLVDGEHTVADYIATGRGLPRMNALPAGSNVVDGTFEVVR